ncbi:MAG: SAM-dependent methyltransferase [Alphaproteobacteria bacterium]|nr:SAM-dependent methyltransferase [Alphaproteobacteria bacterium]
MNKGRLYLIPALIAQSDVEEVLPEGTLKIIRNLTHFIVEEERTARRFLISVGQTKRIDDLYLLVFNEHSDDAEAEQLIRYAIDGYDVGLLSEAGVPCVADPGSVIVKAAHRQGIRIIPLTGPSSILLALMASGFNGQNFVFHGYLPKEKQQRIRKIREIEKEIRKGNQTQIFIETPYRNHQVVETLLQTCRPETLLCVAAGMTGPDEFIQSRKIREWKGAGLNIHKVPAIFLLSEEPFRMGTCNVTLPDASKKPETH